VFDALAVVVCAISLTVARSHVAGLEWPYDGDHYRDVAQAQAALDGHPLSDPFYGGESIWYNPLLSWTVAAGASVARVPPATFHVQAGPWLNLLGPIAFYLLAAATAGRGAAFAALVIFLFFNCRAEPALTCPTYSCWLFVASFAQGFFYLSLLVIATTPRDPTAGRAVMVGALAGLTFLTHTAPALILGTVAMFVLRPRALAIAGATAAAVASPFLVSIAWHYRFSILNDAPMAWRWLPVTLQGFPGALRTDALLITAGLAGALLARNRVLLLWMAVSLSLTAYGLARDWVPALPAVVPAFHFWRSALASLTLLTGVTAWTVCERVAGRYAGVVLASAAALAIAANLQQYRGRFDFVYGRSIARNRDPNHAAAGAFLRKVTREDAVVLGSRGASLQIIGPAGRHVVAVNANWSNPYIENATRVRDRDTMLDLLKSGDVRGFTELADTYRVTHVVGVGTEECAQMSRPLVQLLYTFGEVCVFQRRPAAGS
jgi:hypothetical protein